MNTMNEMKLTPDFEKKLAVLKEEMSVMDKYIRQDNKDIAELESRYEKLDIPYQVRRFLDDYIACMQTKYERLADLCYLAGEQKLVSVVCENNLTELQSSYSVMGK